MLIIYIILRRCCFLYCITFLFYEQHLYAFSLLDIFFQFATICAELSTCLSEYCTTAAILPLLFGIHFLCLMLFLAPMGWPCHDVLRVPILNSTRSVSFNAGQSSCYSVIGHKKNGKTSQTRGRAIPHTFSC